MNDINGFFFSFSGKTFWMMLALTKREGRSYAVTMRLLARPPPTSSPFLPFIRRSVFVSFAHFTPGAAAFSEDRRLLFPRT